MTGFRTAMAPIAALPLMLAACAASAPAGPTVEVTRSLGSVQCTPEPRALARLERQLAAAGVTVIAAREGDDGMMRIALCGSPDGRIGVFTIPADQTARAAAAGFQRR